MPDDLGQQRVEARVRLVPSRRIGVGAHSGPGGGLEHLQHAAGGAHGAVGADRLEVHAGLHSEAAHCDASIWDVAIEPEVGERLTRGEPELRLDEVDACHLLGDRVLDLEACVRLDEPMHVALDEELDRRRVLQARFEREPNRVVDEVLPHDRVEVRCRRDLDDLLVPPLDAAIALTQVDDASCVVAEHLHLDVAYPGDVLLDVQPPIAERSARFGLASRERLGQVAAIAHHAHAAAATARDRLDHRGAAVERVEERERLVDGRRVRRAPQDRDPGARRDRAGLGLVTERGERSRRRTDEDQTLLCAGLREGRLLAEEAVPGMHGRASRADRRVEDLLHVEIRRGAASTQRDGEVGAPHREGVCVVF